MPNTSSTYNITSMSSLHSLYNNARVTCSSALSGHPSSSVSCTYIRYISFNMHMSHGCSLTYPLLLGCHIPFLQEFQYIQLLKNRMIEKPFVQPGTVISSWVISTMLPAGAVAATQSPCRADHPSHADAELRKAKVRQLCFAAGEVCHAPGSHCHALGLSGG